jgi:hypothetical protein
VETRRKTIFRLSELAELRRHQAVERINRFHASMPVISGDIKAWIRAERGEMTVG